MGNPGIYFRIILQHNGLIRKYYDGTILPKDFHQVFYHGNDLGFENILFQRKPWIIQKFKTDMRLVLSIEYNVGFTGTY